jgi:hypothetical protein
MASLADPRTRDAGSAGLRNAARDLRVVAAGADAETASVLHDSGDALDQLALKGITDADATDSAERSLVRLGKRMQGQCHFAVG